MENKDKLINKCFDKIENLTRSLYQKLKIKNEQLDVKLDFEVAFPEKAYNLKGQFKQVVSDD